MPSFSEALHDSPYDTVWETVRSMLPLPEYLGPEIAAFHGVGALSSRLWVRSFFILIATMLAFAVLFLLVFTKLGRFLASGRPGADPMAAGMHTLSFCLHAALLAFGARSLLQTPPGNLVMYLHGDPDRHAAPGDLQLFLYLQALLAFTELVNPVCVVARRFKALFALDLVAFPALLISELAVSDVSGALLLCLLRSVVFVISEPLVALFAAGHRGGLFRRLGRLVAAAFHAVLAAYCYRLFTVALLRAGPHPNLPYLFTIAYRWGALAAAVAHAGIALCIAVSSVARSCPATCALKHAAPDAEQDTEESESATAPGPAPEPPAMSEPESTDRTDAPVRRRRRREAVYADSPAMNTRSKAKARAHVE
jgi:hypothetical protein